MVPTRYAGRNAEFAAVGSRTHYSPRLQPHHSHTWPSARRGSPTLTRSLPHVRAQAAHPARKDGQAAKEADARLKSCDNDVSAACSPQRLSVSRRIQDHWSRTGALERAASSNNQSYAHAAPFPHVSLDGLFPRWIIHALQLEVPDNMSAALAPGADPGQASLPEPRRGWRLTGRPNTVKGGFLKYSLNDERLMGPHVQGAIAAMKSATFIAFLEKLTGITPLLTDASNDGSGVHQIASGGSLRIHSDFNMQHAAFHRRVNVFLYLNPSWDSGAWGGHLELWSRDMRRCVQRIAPLSNRMTIFSTTDFSYHGHADPLRSPPGRSRRSIALYYYTAHRPRHEVLLNSDGSPKKHSTLYQKRRCPSCVHAQCRAQDIMLNSTGGAVTAVEARTDLAAGKGRPDGARRRAHSGSRTNARERSLTLSRSRLVGTLLAS